MLLSSLTSHGGDTSLRFWSWLLTLQWPFEVTTWPLKATHCLLIHTSLVYVKVTHAQTDGRMHTRTHRADSKIPLRGETKWSKKQFIRGPKAVKAGKWDSITSVAMNLTYISEIIWADWLPDLHYAGSSLVLTLGNSLVYFATEIWPGSVNYTFWIQYNSEHHEFLKHAFIWYMSRVWNKMWLTNVSRLQMKITYFCERNSCINCYSVVG